MKIMPEWFILPGMGATSKMYSALNREIDFRINFIDWPVYQSETTFEDVAKRLIDEHQICQNDTIGGSSLGGMIALEIAMLLDSRAVVLMGSALNRYEINRLLGFLAPAAPIIPLSLTRIICKNSKNMIIRMFVDSDPDFIRTMCRYIPLWNGYRGSFEKVHRIHGKTDIVIPCPQDGCEIIENAGHLLPVTHPKACGSFLNRVNDALSK